MNNPFLSEKLNRKNIANSHKMRPETTELMRPETIEMVRPETTEMVTFSMRMKEPFMYFSYTNPEAHL